VFYFLSFSLRRCCLLAIMICLPVLACAPRIVSAAPVNNMGGEGPVRVKADAMTYDTNKNTVVFTGNVEVVRGDFRLWSAILTLYLKASEKQATAPKQDAPPGMEGGELERIVAEKNVRFRYQTQSGEAGKATYTTHNDVLVLEQNPVVRDESNTIKGSLIRYYLKEKRSEVESSPNRRVEAVFQSGGR